MLVGITDIGLSFKVVQYTTAVCGSYLPKWSYNIPEMRTRPRFATVFVITVPF